MGVREIYNILIKRFGKSNIDSILLPCWDKSLEYRDMGGRLISEYPYITFVENMKWFLDTLQERKKNK